MVENAIAAFSLASKSNAMNRGERCGFEGEPPEIEEITIKGPKEVTHTLSPGTPYGFDPDYQFPPSGGCGPYNNCGGGGGTPYQPTPPTPCDRLKTQNNNTEFKNRIKHLADNLDLKKETGYIEKNSGTFDYKDNAGATEDANTLSLPNLDVNKDIKGFMHTHPNDFEDSEGRPRIGFKIFSPADVIYFNRMVRNANQNGVPLGDVYAVMVSGTGTYQIRFTGNAYQIKTTYPNTKEEYNEMYKKFFKANPKNSDEVNFLKFMDEQMYVKGVSLVKMNDNGTFTTKTLNANKTDVANSECPQ